MGTTPDAVVLPRLTGARCGRPFRLTYEELCADREGTILRVLDWLGLEPHPGVRIEPPPELRKQADEVDAEWAARYRALVRE